jgi:endonuclease YncB( thermonuclease family)
MARRLRRKHGIGLLSLLLVLAIAIMQSQGLLDKPEKGVMTAQPGLYSIDHYVDGDTISVDMNGQKQEVRFIGIDTPETHKPNTPVQCYGPAAAAYTQNRIKAAGGKVRLVSDSLSTNRDRYDRLLRYVYLPDGTDLNQQLVANGYAFYYPYFPFSKSDQFNQDEQAALAAKKGLWAACHPTPSDNGGYKMDETQAEASG